MDWYLPRSPKLTPGQNSLMSLTIFSTQILAKAGTGKVMSTADLNAPGVFSIHV